MPHNLRQRFSKLTSPSRGEVDPKGRVGVVDSAESPMPERIASPSGGFKPFTKQTLQFARGLRKGQTDAEQLLWQQLRNTQLGIKFRRQQPIGKYIVDFVSMDLHLIIEVDGGQHNESAHDKQRDTFLRDEGYQVLRFWNNEVLENIDGVCARIMEVIAQSRLQEGPPPVAHAPTSPLEGEVSVDKTNHTPSRREVCSVTPVLASPSRGEGREDETTHTSPLRGEVGRRTGWGKSSSRAKKLHRETL